MTRDLTKRGGGPDVADRPQFRGPVLWQSRFYMQVHVADSVPVAYWLTARAFALRETWGQILITH